MLNTSLVNMQVMNIPITDTNPHNANTFPMEYMNQTALILMNGTNQQVTVSTLWSQDGITPATTIGTTTTVAAGGSLVTNQFDSILTGLKAFGGFLTLSVVAGTAPTSGNVTAYMQGMCV